MRAALAYLSVLGFAGIGSAWHGRLDGLSLVIWAVAGAVVFGLVRRAANAERRP